MGRIVVRMVMNVWVLGTMVVLGSRATQRVCIGRMTGLVRVRRGPLMLESGMVIGVRVGRGGIPGGALWLRLDIVVLDGSWRVAVE